MKNSKEKKEISAKKWRSEEILMNLFIYKTCNTSKNI